ncbi:hypothetical protein [uncultured Flavobacterium sp.]|uniref:hypothetical protein n=1 Tax=uncultured Flavobacterium sp. TaxID=165435 RepID=UPI0025FD7746|nr:hypothetical protein [uncultured Flavobacterium sp.]
MMKKTTNFLAFLVTLFSFMAVSAQNTASTSGNWDDCATWGNPTSIIQNATDTKTINTGVNVVQNTAWSTNNITLNGNGAVIFASSANAVDFVTDLGADKSCASPIVSGLTCSSGTTSGTVTSQTPLSGVSRTIPYSGGNSAPYAAGSGVASTGVTGLTATLQAGTLTASTGNLTYAITGTPSGSGTASFAITFGGINCSFAITVAQGVVFDNSSSNCGFTGPNGWLFTGNWQYAQTSWSSAVESTCEISGDNNSDNTIGTGMAYRSFTTVVGRVYTVLLITQHIGYGNNGHTNTKATVYPGSATSGAALGTVTSAAPNNSTNNNNSFTFTATANTSTVTLAEVGTTSLGDYQLVKQVKITY